MYGFSGIEGVCIQCKCMHACTLQKLKYDIHTKLPLESYQIQIFSMIPLIWHEYHTSVFAVCNRKLFVNIHAHVAIVCNAGWTDQHIHGSILVLMVAHWLVAGLLLDDLYSKYCDHVNGNCSDVDGRFMALAIMSYVSAGGWISTVIACHNVLC